MLICDVTDASEMVSNEAPQTTRLALLDLPQLVLENIVIFIRRMTRWDGYLSDLRLVSSTFDC